MLCTWRGWNGTFPGYSGASSGRRASVKDANNNLSQLVYNPFDRLLELHFPNGTAGSGTASATDFESYLYDPNGNRTSLTKRDRTTTIGYTFDTLNRVIVKDTRRHQIRHRRKVCIGSLWTRS